MHLKESKVRQLEFYPRNPRATGCYIYKSGKIVTTNIAECKGREGKAVRMSMVA
jgi:hypothetical protein